MIRSMTGYSRAEVQGDGFSLSVSLKATNHRYLDLQVRLPDQLASLETALRRLVSVHVTRGHLEVSVSLEQLNREGLAVNRNLLETYAAACQQLRREFGWKAEPDPVALLRVPGMIGVNGGLAEGDLERFKAALEKATSESLERLNEMRSREGEELERDLRGRFARLEELAKAVGQLTDRIPELYRRRLESRVQELLGNLELDRARLAQEVAWLASRSDITEELVRFRSHLEQARQLLDGPSPAPGSRLAEVGKKLDFLLQELNREANTLLSKVTDVPEVGLEISRSAIEMKTEIEKLREQAQNIE